MFVFEYFAFQVIRGTKKQLRIVLIELLSKAGSVEIAVGYVSYVFLCELENFPFTKEQIDEELKKGTDDIQESRVYTAEQVEAEMKKDYGI